VVGCGDQRVVGFWSLQKRVLAQKMHILNAIFRILFKKSRSPVFFSLAIAMLILGNIASLGFRRSLRA
jgi:hypothetical protein